MSVEVTLVSQATVRETIETGVPAASSANAIVTHSLYDNSAALSASSSVPVTKTAVFEKNLVAGAATIDLTSLTGTNGAAVDGTGLKVQVFKVRAKTTNTLAISVSEGASNGYELLGDAFTFDLLPGQHALFYLNDAAPDIASGAKNIDLAGNGTEGLEITIVMG